MRNQHFFEIKVTNEQVAYAKDLVAYSMQHHTISNIWDGTNAEKNTVDLRFTGSLGEILFADAYQLPRPTRSYGANDGQDLGKDFELVVDGELKSFDIKSMRRVSNNFYSDYVLNIPSSQLNKPDSLTDYYFHINIHPKIGTDFVGSFVGYASKEEIKVGTIGKLYKAGTYRTRKDGTKFQFTDDTYEVDLADLTTPPLTDLIKQLDGFAFKKIRQKV